MTDPTTMGAIPAPAQLDDDLMELGAVSKDTKALNTGWVYDGGLGYFGMDPSPSP